MRHPIRWTLLLMIPLTFACTSPTEPTPIPLAGTWTAEHHVTLCGSLDCMVFPERWTLEIQPDESTASIVREWGPVSPWSCDGTIQRDGDAVTVRLPGCAELAGGLEGETLTLSGVWGRAVELGFRREDLDPDPVGP